MDYTSFCTPSLIYLIFGLTQVCLDIYQGYYNMALMKILVTIIFTLLLNAMCLSGMTVLAWMIIAIPFILMSVIISMLLFVFGLNPKTGRVMNTINGVNYSDISQSQILNSYNDVKDDYDEYDKKNIDAREYQLLYGDDEEDTRLTKDEIMYLWNRRFIYDEGYVFEKDISGGSRMLLNSDIISDSLNEDINDFGYHTKKNNNYNRLNIIGKKITFTMSNDKTRKREILFYPNNRTTLDSENGFYYINGNIVKINNNITFIFPHSKVRGSHIVEVYDNDRKLNTNMIIDLIENL